MAEAGSRERIEAIARAVRSFLEPHWMCWHGRDDDLTGRLSRGACDHSSLFLCCILRRAGLDARFATGAPADGAFGYLMDGTWMGHAWVECAGLVIDITADQFGGPPIRIVPAGDPCFSGGEDAADVEIALRREEAVARLLERWDAKDTTTDCGAMFAPSAT